MSLPSINLLHITVSEIKPGQGFQTRGNYDKIKGQIKVTMTLHIIVTSFNLCPYQGYHVSTSYTLWFLRYSPDTLPPAQPDTMGKNNTCATFKGCRIKIHTHCNTSFMLDMVHLYRM